MEARVFLEVPSSNLLNRGDWNALGDAWIRLFIPVSACRHSSIRMGIGISVSTCISAELSGTIDLPLCFYFELTEVVCRLRDEPDEGIGLVLRKPPK